MEMNYVCSVPVFIIVNDALQTLKIPVDSDDQQAAVKPKVLHMLWHFQTQKICSELFCLLVDKMCLSYTKNNELNIYFLPFLCLWIRFWIESELNIMLMNIRQGHERSQII